MKEKDALTDMRYIRWEARAVRHACLGFPSLNSQNPAFADTMQGSGYDGTSPPTLLLPHHRRLGPDRQTPSGSGRLGLGSFQIRIF